MTSCDMIVKVIKMILSCSSLTKSCRELMCLKDITFKIEEHDKLAIIGVNGAGKSTLLRILQKEENYDTELNMVKNIQIGYLSQEHVFDLDKSSMPLWRTFWKLDTDWRTSAWIGIGDEQFWSARERHERIWSALIAFRRKVAMPWNHRSKVFSMV